MEASAKGGAPSSRRLAAIFLVSLAGLLLEVGYTRIISYKLWYYYTYLVIGLSLLGIGSGGIVLAVSARLKAATTERILGLAALGGAVSVAVGYAVVAWLPINTYDIWNYGTAASFGNFGLLAVLSFALFATFVALGVILATLLGRAADGDLGRLYFADLLGAGAGCVVAIPLIARLGPPRVVVLAAVVFAAVALLFLPRGAQATAASKAVSLRAWARSPWRLGAAGVAVLLAVGVVAEDTLPEVRPETTKNEVDRPAHSEWGPVFRVDLTGPLPPEGKRMLVHDGSYGSGIWEWDGKVASLTRYEDDARRIPFGLLGGAPGRELIIGSAGGNEILASLYYEAKHIEAVELNPVTVKLLRHDFAGLTGHLAERPEVDLHVGDGRSYLARSDGRFDLVWYVAPDSYAATNAASSGAFVLSESYLYTHQMVEETLRHLSDDGIMVVQFGELDIDQPSRTARYIVTARKALHDLGIDDPARHLAVSAQTTPGLGSLSTIVVKRTPLTQTEVDGFADTLADMSSEHRAIYAPGGPNDGSVLAKLSQDSDNSVSSIVDNFPRDISAVSDDAPFFWHFTRFGDVLAHVAEPIDVFVADPEQAIGERVLLLLLGLAAAYAAAFLLLPFLVVRRGWSWSELPAKRTSALYFACLGLGFMFYEVTMIQRLVRFLGYPTYSLTVTLASILISTGCGALLSRRLAARSRSIVPLLLAALAVLTLFYQLGLDPLEDALQGQGLAVRVGLAVVVLVPLGLCLGMFMPFGLEAVGRLSPRAEEYVAWSWAVNGFFSVIGSVLTTILSMALGFTVVQYLALVVYGVAVVAFTRLARRSATVVDGNAVAAATAEPELTAAPA